MKIKASLSSATLWVIMLLMLIITSTSIGAAIAIEMFLNLMPKAITPIYLHLFTCNFHLP
jgi:hypothetical protein